MKFLVKLSEEDALVKGPPRRSLVLVDLPSLSHDAIFDDSGVGDERVYTPACHHGHRVATVDGWCCVFYLLLTRGDDSYEEKTRDINE